MGKPGYRIFVGVGEDGLSDEDKAKLPEIFQKIHDFEIVPTDEQARMAGIRFDRFDSGNPSTSDPGSFAGFGVEVYSGHYDAGTTRVNTMVINSKARALRRDVSLIWKALGLKAKPEILSYCFWD